MPSACTAQEFACQHKCSGMPGGDGRQLRPGSSRYPEPLRQRIALLGVERQWRVIAQRERARRDEVKEFAGRSVLSDEKNLVFAVEQGNELRERLQAFAC